MAEASVLLHAICDAGLSFPFPPLAAVFASWFLLSARQSRASVCAERGQLAGHSNFEPWTGRHLQMRVYALPLPRSPPSRSPHRSPRGTSSSGLSPPMGRRDNKEEKISQKYLENPSARTVHAMGLLAPCCAAGREDMERLYYRRMEARGVVKVHLPKPHRASRHACGTPRGHRRYV